MRSYLERLWQTGLVGTFLTGLFFVLPIALTVVIVGWLIGKVEAVLGPGTWAWQTLSLGGTAIIGTQHETVAFWLGLLLALGGIWLLGFVVRTRARLVMERTLTGFLKHVPVVRTIYGPISQVVELLRGGGADDVKGMSVVLCRFGRDDGASVLALLTGPTRYALDTGPAHLVYLPGSPLPMSGALIFLPVESVVPVPDLDVDGLMRIYFSLGTLTPGEMPGRFLAGSASVPAA